MIDRLLRTRPPPVALWVSAAGVAMALAFAGLYRWDNWFLNPDGAFYLSVVDSILALDGPRFPDGTLVALRGPAYATWLSASWALASETTRTAIWASRSLLVLNAGLVALVARRWGPAPSLIGGLLAAIGPLYLLSGGLFLVPDGLAAALVLVALAALQSDRPAMAGLALGGALLAKETAVLALAAVAVAIILSEHEHPWKRTDSMLLGSAVLPGAWLLYLAINGETAPVLVVVLVLALVGAAVARLLDARAIRAVPIRWTPAVWLLLVAGSVAILAMSVSPLVGVGEWWDLFDREIRNQLFGPTALWPIAVAVVGVVGITLVRPDDDVLTALTVSAVGVAAILHAAVAGLGLRNGLLAGYGIALLAGRLSGSEGWRRIVAVPMAATLLVTGYLGAEFVNEKFNADALTWDAPPVHATAAFLEENASVVVTTSAYGPWLAHLAPSPAFVLAPTGIVSERIDDRLPSIDRLVDWAGTKRNPAQTAAEVIGVLRLQTISASRADLWRVIEETGATHVAVTGNTTSSAASTDGGLWLVLAEEDPGLERSFATDPSTLPHWLVVYEVIGDGPPPHGSLQVYYVADPPAGDYPAGTRLWTLFDFRDEVLTNLSAR